MAPSSSSTKKAAKLAKTSRGKKVRFQGGTTFPLIVTIVVVLGLLLVAFARQSRDAVDASPPTRADHWTHSYGFYLCDSWFQLEGNAETADTGDNAAYLRTGVHSQDDGLIHWHPFSDAAVGTNARLGVFLDTYDVELTNSKLTFPEAQRAALEKALPNQQDPLVFEDDKTKCSIGDKQESSSLKVIVWNNFNDTGSGTTYIADFRNIRLNKNQMVVAMAFVPDNTDVGLPPWTPKLSSLSDVPLDTVPTGSTPAGGSTPGSVPSSPSNPPSTANTTVDAPSTTG